MRRLAGGLALCAACNGEPGVTGEWEVHLFCDGVNNDAPACRLGDLIVLELNGTDPVSGSHLSLFPGHARSDGAYSGMTGPVTGEWLGVELDLWLHGDVDYPFASDGDREAWSNHALRITGVPSNTCWNGAFQWLDDDGVVDIEGEVSVARFDGGCP